MFKIFARLCLVAALLGPSATSAQQVQGQWWFYDLLKSQVIGPFDHKKDCEEIAEWSRNSTNRPAAGSKCWQGSAMVAITR